MRAWIDMSLMLLTFFGTIIWNVEIGILVSLVISLLLVVHRSSKTRMLILVGGFGVLSGYIYSILTKSEGPDSWDRPMEADK